MSFLCYGLNSLLCLGYGRKYRKFLRCSDLKAQQEDKLLGILRANKSCQWGQKYGFGAIRSVEQYQRAVPLTRYEDYELAVGEICQTGKNVLYSEPTLLLEQSSGSTAGAKLVPYTKGLKSEFDWGIAPWYYNLYTHYPALKWGKSYWSITPVGSQPKKTASGIPIGFEEDAGYLGVFAGRLQKRLFAVDSGTVKQTEMAEFRQRTCTQLLACRNLRFVSVWNPTFFLLLLDYMTDHREELTTDSQILEALESRDYSAIWPQLGVISCWASANAERYARQLGALFPKVVVQPKGLLATECFVSFPLGGEVGSRLAAFSHFFEFLEKDSGRVVLAHQLVEGARYQVVVTTSGGLYRYQLGDVIQVVSTKEVIPTLEFVGRGDKVSDLFGEKLSDLFVGGALDQLFAHQGISPTFAMLAPETDRYRLYLKSERLLAGLDQALCKNFHYEYCRRLGQLKPAEVVYLGGNPTQDYLNHCVSLGQKLGNVKPVALHLRGGWAEVFTEGEKPLC